MPKKEETELQFLRLLRVNTLQGEVDFLQMSGLKSSPARLTLGEILLSI